MGEETLRKELHAAHEARARFYYLLFDEMRREIGEERAAAVMKRAILRQGRKLGEQFSGFAPHDFQGLCSAFLQNIPDEGRLFSPKVLRCDEEGLDIEFFSCPLKRAWRDMGLSEEECAKICDIAAIVDTGTFEGAGFSFSMEALPQGRGQSCILRIRPPEEKDEDEKSAFSRT